MDVLARLVSPAASAAAPARPAGDGDVPAAQAVFEILVREHADMLAAYLRSLVRDPGAADDLFQEAMLVAWRRLGDFDRSRPFAPWLRGIAAKLVLAHQRNARTRPFSMDSEFLDGLERRYAASERLPGDTFRERAAAIGDCAAALPDVMREALDLAYSRGLLLAQIAQAVGASEETIKKRVQRARQAIADCLDKLARGGAPA